MSTPGERSSELVEEGGGFTARMRRSCFGAALLAVVVVASGVALASGQPSSAAESGSTASALPTWLHKTVSANAYVATASPFVRVPSRTVRQCPVTM